jgi:hypothetical protein
VIERPGHKRTTGCKPIWLLRALSALCVALLVSGFVNTSQTHDAGHGYALSAISAMPADTPSGDCHDEGSRVHGNACPGLSGCSFAALTPDAATSLLVKASPTVNASGNAPDGVTSAPGIRPPKISA